MRDLAEAVGTLQAQAQRERSYFVTLIGVNSIEQIKGIPRRSVRRRVGKIVDQLLREEIRTFVFGVEE